MTHFHDVATSDVECKQLSLRPAAFQKKATTPHPSVLVGDPGQAAADMANEQRNLALDAAGPEMIAFNQSEALLARGWRQGARSFT
jgi:hypothetical protein